MDARLEHAFEASAAGFPGSNAVEELSGRTITYAELNRNANLLSAGLSALGVVPGDRVGILLPKAIEAVAAILGILKCRAAYVPMDVEAPAVRTGLILEDCQPKVVITSADYLDKLPGAVIQTDLGFDLMAVIFASPEAVHAPPELAYILYTSGSTGRPKGVMLTHENALSFIDWCSGIFRPTPQDRFSSHAPFHFDLSVFDVFVCLKHGGTLVLIGTAESKSPAWLAEIASQQRVSIWYSTPTTLSAMTQYGKMERLSFDNLRLVLFAGEVFPVKMLHALQSKWSHADFYNLYGPTETNVCTYFKLPKQPDWARTDPYPIGMSCSHCDVQVVDSTGQLSDEGELIVSGYPVMSGYMGQPHSEAFTVRDGKTWYKTGDIVRRLADGNLLFVGRLDRMVKRRGYRIELGEIETVLRNHEDILEAAVTSRTDGEGATRITAHIGLRPGSRASVVHMKQYCAGRLPMYMMPDEITFHEVLPKTSTHKLDYQALQAQT
jgi:amino acid adenylation domain-containing protein